MEINEENVNVQPQDEVNDHENEIYNLNAEQNVSPNIFLISYILFY